MTKHLSSIDLNAYIEAVSLALSVPDRNFFRTWSNATKRAMAQSLRSGSTTLPDVLEQIHNAHSSALRQAQQLNQIGPRRSR